MKKEIRLTIVARESTWHTDELVREGKNKGVDVEVINIKSLNGLNKLVDSLGDVVFWRSSSLDIPLARSVFLERVAKKRELFNRGIGENPLIPLKFYQQKMINPLKTITGIPTYHFRGKTGLKNAVRQGLLKFPLVMKKNLSARGAGVYKLSSIKEVGDLKIIFKDYVFQNYIKNDGDFRVLVLGGVALGIIKRVKGSDEFRNNISLGGQAVDVRDLPEAADLKNKAVNIASKFGLQFCGVDFIYDQEDKIYRFMEVNTVPQWEGFQGATGINVTEKVIEYVKSLAEGGRNDTLIRNYYDRFVEVLPRSVVFHYYSRLWMWSGDKKARAGLDRLKSWYLGEDDIEKRISGLSDTTDKENPVTDRKKTYQKYKGLLRVNNLLFWWWMAKSVYQKDLTQEIDKSISSEELNKLCFDLVSNEDDIWVLSSAAINFLYFMELYAGKKVDSAYWVRMVENRLPELKDKDLVKRAFYFLSHIVIGETGFYSKQKIEQLDVCTDAVLMMEKMIEDNYFNTSLDMKFEFLVCCRIVNHVSRLEKMIMGEAERSKSGIGNFLVDTCNIWKHGFGNKLSFAEHRNVLYLMACGRMRV